MISKDNSLYNVSRDFSLPLKYDKIYRVNVRPKFWHDASFFEQTGHFDSKTRVNLIIFSGRRQPCGTTGGKSVESFIIRNRRLRNSPLQCYNTSLAWCARELNFCANYTSYKEIMCPFANSLPPCETYFFFSSPLSICCPPFLPPPSFLPSLSFRLSFFLSFFMPSC